MREALVLEDAVKAMSDHLAAEPSAPHRAGEQTLWLHLLQCLLSSQVSYHTAQVAAHEVKSILFEFRNGGEEALAETLANRLRAPLESGKRYRFPNSRANQIASAWFRVQRGPRRLKTLLSSTDSEVDLRNQLVGTIPGLGIKQASLFLRDIGMARELAIIDRHVLAYIHMLALDNVPGKLTHASYRRLEHMLCGYAAFLGHSVAIVDHAIWLIVRAAKSEPLA